MGEDGLRRHEAPSASILEGQRRAPPKEKEEADCADKQPDPTHHVSDERQKFDVVRTLRAVAVTGTIFEAGHEPPP